MAMKTYKPTSSGRRQRTDVDSGHLSKERPLKVLTRGKKGAVGRSKGRVTIRHRQQGAKKLYRRIDFKRDKRDIPGRVASLEYDPNRSANIALIVYPDGEKRYILAPAGLKVGETVVAGEKVEVKDGNAMPLKNIPVGLPVHNLELSPGKGGQLVRSAGAAARITAKEEKYVRVEMPSKEVRRILADCFATLGQVSKVEHRAIKLGKAGRKRHMGVRPTVRGVAQDPRSHPHGGGEGRSGIGMKSPKSPWGKRTLGKKTRKRKYTDKFIVKRRK
jgi:large subunit ribosomal protein L2